MFLFCLFLEPVYKISLSCFSLRDQGLKSADFHRALCDYSKEFVKVLKIFVLFVLFNEINILLELLASK